MVLHGEWNDLLRLLVCVCACFKNELAFDVCYKIFCQQIIGTRMTVNRKVLRPNQFLSTRLQIMADGIKTSDVVFVCLGENPLPISKVVKFLPLCYNCNNCLNWDVKVVKQPSCKNVCDGKLLCTDEYTITGS